MGVFVIFTLASLLLEPLQAAGSLRSTDITPLLRYCEPLRHPLAGPRLPGFAGYTVPSSADFATGRGGLLHLLAHPCHRAAAVTPPKWSRRFSQSATIHDAFAP